MLNCRYTWPELLLLTCVSIFSLVASVANAQSQGCASIPLDSAGIFSFRVSAIRFYSQLQVYLDSHNVADSIQINLPQDRAASVAITDIELHGDSRVWPVLQCKRYEFGAVKISCWKSVAGRSPLVLGVTLRDRDDQNIETAFDEVMKYVEHDVFCSAAPVR